MMERLAIDLLIVAGAFAYVFAASWVGYRVQVLVKPRRIRPAVVWAVLATLLLPVFTAPFDDLVLLNRALNYLVLLALLALPLTRGVMNAQARWFADETGTGSSGA